MSLYELVTHEVVDHEAREHFSSTGHMPTVFEDNNGKYITWACKICDCYPELDRI